MPGRQQQPQHSRAAAPNHTAVNHADPTPRTTATPRKCRAAPRVRTEAHSGARGRSMDQPATAAAARKHTPEADNTQACGDGFPLVCYSPCGTHRHDHDRRRCVLFSFGSSSFGRPGRKGRTDHHARHDTWFGNWWNTAPHRPETTQRKPPATPTAHTPATQPNSTGAAGVLDGETNTATQSWWWRPAHGSPLAPFQQPVATSGVGLHLSSVGRETMCHCW